LTNQIVSSAQNPDIFPIHLLGSQSQMLKSVFWSSIIKILHILRSTPTKSLKAAFQSGAPLGAKIVLTSVTLSLPSSIDFVYPSHVTDLWNNMIGITNLSKCSTSCQWQLQSSRQQSITYRINIFSARS
jgi:hypothetical protein